jgi:hypothetical protein
MTDNTSLFAMDIESMSFDQELPSLTNFGPLTAAAIGDGIQAWQSSTESRSLVATDRDPGMIELGTKVPGSNGSPSQQDIPFQPLPAAGHTVLSSRKLSDAEIFSHYLEQQLHPSPPQHLQHPHPTKSSLAQNGFLIDQTPDSASKPHLTLLQQSRQHQQSQSLLSSPCHDQPKIKPSPTRSSTERTLQDWKLLLHIAAENGHESIVKTLLERDFDINEKDSTDRTALHLAIKAKHEGVLRLLLASGADVNACDRFGWTPVHQAAENGFVVGLRLLLMHGANVSLRASCKE